MVRLAGTERAQLVIEATQRNQLQVVLDQIDDLLRTQSQGELVRKTKYVGRLNVIQRSFR